MRHELRAREAGCVQQEQFGVAAGRIARRESYSTFVEC
jgi:hypothetical protein